MNILLDLKVYSSCLGRFDGKKKCELVFFWDLGIYNIERKNPSRISTIKFKNSN